MKLDLLIGDRLILNGEQRIVGTDRKGEAILLKYSDINKKFSLKSNQK